MPVIPRFTHPSLQPLHPPPLSKKDPEPYSPSPPHTHTHPQHSLHTFTLSLVFLPRSVSLSKRFCGKMTWRCWQRHAYAMHVRASGDTQRQRGEDWRWSVYVHVQKKGRDRACFTQCVGCYCVRGQIWLFSYQWMFLLSVLRGVKCDLLTTTGYTNLQQCYRQNDEFHTWQ